MGAIGRSLETAERERGRTTNLAITLREMRRQQEIDQQQKEERQKRDAQFILDALTQEWSDPRRWKDSTPQEQGAALFKINSARNIRGLDELDSLQDPRPESSMGDAFQMQTWAQKRIPFPIVRHYFETKYGRDWLTNNNVTSANRESLGLPPPGMEGMELPGQAEALGGAGVMEAKPAPETETAASQEAAGAVAPGAAEQPSKPITARAWDEALEEIYNEYRTEPLSIADAMSLQKLLGEPDGIYMLAQTEDGLDRIHTTGKMMGIPERLWASDQNEYFTHVQERIQKLSEKERREKNAKARLAFLPEIRRLREQGTPALEAASLIYDGLKEIGYDGTLEELAQNIGAMPTTSPQEDRTYEAMMQRIQNTADQFKVTHEVAMRRLGISQAQLDLARDRLKLDIKKFEAEGGGTGVSAEAKEFALSGPEKTKAKGYGFSETAILHGPKRVRELVNAAKDDPKSKWWERIDPYDPKAATKLTAAGKARIKEINESEREAAGKRPASSSAKATEDKAGGKVNYQARVMDARNINATVTFDGKKISLKDWIDTAKDNKQTDQAIYEWLLANGLVK